MRNGCSVPTPAADRSAGRYPDGVDTNSNCADFLVQVMTTLAAASTGGTMNIKVASVADFEAGQTITIDRGVSPETAVIATVGTAGATSLGTATEAGATAIPVASVEGFRPGQTVTIDGGANVETATVASVTRRGDARITLAAPLTSAHAAGAQVSGTGITFTAPLTAAHASGAQVTSSDPPTPGAPNQYHRRAQ